MKRGQRMAAWLARVAFFAAVSGAIAAFLYWRFDWQGRRGASDALFLAGLLDLLIAGVSVWGWPADGTTGVAERLLTGVIDPPGSEAARATFREDLLRKETFALTLLVTGLLTIAAAAAFLYL